MRRLSLRLYVVLLPALLLLLPQIRFNPHRENPHHVGERNERILFRPPIAVVNPIWDGAVVYYKLDEESAGVAPVTRNDSIGTRHLTDNNTTPSAAGLVGLAAAPNSGGAFSEYLSVVNDSGLQVGAGDGWSVAFWLKRTGNMVAGGQGLISRGASGIATHSWFIQDNASATQIVAQSVSGTTLSGATAPALTLSLDVWTFIVLRKATGNSVVTLTLGDSSSTAVSPSAGQTNSGTVPFNINARNGAQFQNNVLYDCVVYYPSRLLSTANITTLHNGGTCRVYPN